MTTLKPIAECKTVAELLADKSRWTQRAYARLPDGHSVMDHNEDAVCFCVVGAIKRVYSDRVSRLMALDLMMAKCGCANIDKFNDTHTYAEVYAKVLEANI